MLGGSWKQTEPPLDNQPKKAGAGGGFPSPRKSQGRQTRIGCIQITISPPLSIKG